MGNVHARLMLEHLNGLQESRLAFYRQTFTVPAGDAPLPVWRTELVRIAQHMLHHDLGLYDELLDTSLHGMGCGAWSRSDAWRQGVQRREELQSLLQRLRQVATQTRETQHLQTIPIRDVCRE